MSYSRLLETLRSELPSDKPILVGFSGGLDSSLLLQLVCDAVPRQRVLAIHCNHGVSPKAAQWQRFCEQQAAALNLNLVVESLQFPQGFSEAAGREARYRAFERHMVPGAVLMLAHHADDQEETMLFRLFRGTGMRGLAGIRRQRSFASGILLRPLLELGKQDIEAMARERGLSWIEDESNADPGFDRNYIRLELLPKIRRRWPQLSQSLRRLSALLLEDSALLDDFADELLTNLDLSTGDTPGTLASFGLDAFAALSGRQQSLVLRRLLSRFSGGAPSAFDLPELLSQFLHSRADADPRYQVGDLEFRRFHGRLFLLSADRPSPPSGEISWDGRAPLAIEGLGRLVLRQGPPDEFVVRFRRGGERLKPLDRGHSQTLKKLLQEYQVEPWLRDCLPLVYCRGEILAVADRIHCGEQRFELIAD